MFDQPQHINYHGIVGAFANSVIQQSEFVPAQLSNVIEHLYDTLRHDQSFNAQGVGYLSPREIVSILHTALMKHQPFLTWGQWMDLDDVLLVAGNLLCHEADQYEREA